MVMVQIMDTEITTYNVVSSLTGEVLKRFSHNELYNLLFEFSSEADWDNANSNIDPICKQVRAVFTTLCLMFNIKANTYHCNMILDEVYSQFIIGKFKIEQDDFENYMLDCIV